MDLYTIRKQLNMGIPLTKINLRVTYYSRVSTDSKQQHKSLTNQIEHFDKLIKSNSNWIYIDGYVDDGITGTSDIKRNNFMKMINDAKNNKFDLIITKEISRFSRNTLDSIKYTRKLLKDGVAVLFVNDNINTALPDSELRLTIMASLAQDEIRRLSERVKFGMNRAIQRGEILGNNRLYGYRKNKDTKKLEINETEANIVRMIYEMYALENLSLSEICHKLNKETPKKWYIATISRMIENPKYKGFYCGKKTEVIDYMTKKVKYINKKMWITYEDKEHIPPLVDNYLWKKANDRLLSRKKTKHIVKSKYLYSGKIFCKEHSTVFQRRYFRKNKQDVTWMCKIYLTKGKNTCNSANIREKELNYIFYDLIKKLNINKVLIKNLLIKYYKDIDINQDIDFNLNKLNNEKKNISIKKSKLLDLNLSDSLSKEEFILKNNELNQKLKELERDEYNLLNTKLKDNNMYKEITKYLNKILNSSLVDNKIIELLLNHIEVSKDNNYIKLDIYLNFDYQKDLLNNKYTFKRGYDTKNTKRYEVFYLVNCYFI